MTGTTIYSGSSSPSHITISRIFSGVPSGTSPHLDDDWDGALGFRPESPAKNLIQVTGGNFQVHRQKIFLDSAGHLVGQIIANGNFTSVNDTMSNFTATVSGTYTGPTNIVSMGANTYDLHQKGAGDVIGTYRIPFTTSSGSVVTELDTAEFTYSGSGVFPGDEQAIITVDSIVWHPETLTLNWGGTAILKMAGSCSPLDSLMINTGFDQVAGTTLAVGNTDKDWTVVWDNDPLTNEPRPPRVVSPAVGWASPQPQSQWISPYDGNITSLPGHYYRFEYYFCLAETTDAQLCMNIRVVDTANVYLNGQEIGSVANNSGTSSTPIKICATNSNLFRTGKNTLRIDLYSSMHPITGINVVGSVKGSPSEWCCCGGSAGGLMGTVYNDANWNHKLDAGEHTLRNWWIMLSNGTPGGTKYAVTDSFGHYYFLGLPPGNYTVTELAKPFWVPYQPLHCDNQPVRQVL